MFRSIYPVTGQVIDEIPFCSNREMNYRLEVASRAFERWSPTDLVHRLEMVKKVESGLEEARQDLAEMITWEMGKPLTQSMAEVEKCQWLCREYIGRAEGWIQTHREDFDGLRIEVRYDPTGAVFGIMPWNFPIWQVMRYAIPSLIAGNAVLLKPAPNVGLTSRILEEIFQNATEIEGLFQLLLIDTDQVESVIASDVVQGVTLTGSARAGSAVASLAGKYLKKSVLELGGSDPFIVFGDADIEKAAEVFVQSRMNNSGQTCIAAKRAIIHSRVVEQFIDLVVEQVNVLTVGDPFDDDCDISALARPDLAGQLHEQYEKSIIGAKRVVINGGRRGESCYFDPAVLVGVDPGSPAWNEELFGPVIVIEEGSDEDAMVNKANDTGYGLGASVWSADEGHAAQIASRINAGSIHINAMVSSDPRVPFGGVKRSGYGRELGRDGLLEFTNVKTLNFRDGS